MLSFIWESFYVIVSFFFFLQGDTGSPGPPGLPGTVSKIVFGAVTIFKTSLHFLHINSSETNIFKFLTSLQNLWDLFTLRFSPFISEKQYQDVFDRYTFYFFGEVVPSSAYLQKQTKNT